MLGSKEVLYRISHPEIKPPLSPSPVKANLQLLLSNRMEFKNVNSRLALTGDCQNGGKYVSHRLYILHTHI